jgi:integrase
MSNDLDALKSGGEVAEQPQKEQVSRTHSAYWKSRIFRDGYTRKGERILAPDYSVRIQHAGRRETFALATPVVAKAADKAKVIYVYLLANGWDATLAKFKPQPLAPATKVATVGSVIEAVEAIATVKRRSFKTYAHALRLIASEIAGIAGGNKVKFAYRNEAFKAWRTQVEAVSLDAINPLTVAKWRTARLEAATNPVERLAAERTTDSYIRNAKALFGRELVPNLRRSLTLPDPLPFDGLVVSTRAARFKPTVRPELIFAAAKEELEKQHPEQWKAFVLSIFAGLRRGEADNLTWGQINLGEGTLTIEATPYFAPKNAEETRVVELNPETVAMIARFKSKADHPVFVLHGGPAKPRAEDQYYRADCAPRHTWKRLIAWLRSKGITSNKPVHELRKHAGALIHAVYGIESARAFLGHRDIATTSASYVDRRPRVAVSMPALDEFSAERSEAHHA